MTESASYGGQVRPDDIQFFYVYILHCNNDTTYVGYTSDLKDRLSRHQKGYVPSTKNLRPVKLLTYISFMDKYKAVAFEKYLKTGSGRAFLRKRLI
jgi:predicted GIY-YIG superfamily endonuclease